MYFFMTVISVPIINLQSFVGKIAEISNCNDCQLLIYKKKKRCMRLINTVWGILFIHPLFFTYQLNSDTEQNYMQE